MTGPASPVGPGGAPDGLVATAADRFRRQATATPDALAVQAGEAGYSYAELCAWVDELAAGLAGAGPERVVGVSVARSPAQVAAVLAVLSTRSVYLPLDPQAPAARTRMILDDAAPTLLVHDSTTRALADPAGAPALEIGPTPASRSDRLASPAGTAHRRLVDPGLPAYLMYTSGSTGRPKGVLMCAGALDNLLDWHLADLAPGPGRRVAQFTAAGFDIWVQEVLSTLVSGATLVIPGSDTCRTPARLARWLGTHRITDLFCPNVMVEAVCEAALSQALALPELAHIAQAGEQLTLSANVRAFFQIRPGRRLHNHYGPTETHAATSCVLPADPADWPDRATIGSPIPRTRVHLLDARLRELPDGLAGEVYVSGAALARGYRGRPGLTADRFLPCPFGEPGERMYRTGDVARRLPDGQLAYLGRADQQVKIRGVRVELGEVDAAIRARPEVRDVAVLARGEGSARRLDCYLVPAPGVPDAVASVRAALGETLLPEMVPSSFTLLDALPTNSNGKVDRNALAPPAGTAAAPGEQPRPVTAADGNPTTTLTQLFADCLELDRVDEDDDFFALGGHSLSAARLTARVRAVLGQELSISDVFANPSVAKLRRCLRERTHRLPPVLAQRGTGMRPAAFAQDRLWVIDQFSGPSALYNVPIVLRLRGRVEVEALRAAVRDLLERHEALRSRLVCDAEGLRQDVLPTDAAFAFERVVVDPADRPAAIRRAAGRPFDLESESPVRSTLFVSGDDSYDLLLLVHHAAVDGWSVKPLLKDLGFAYACRRVGLAPCWQPLPVRYGDYAAWQRSQFGADRPAGEHRRQLDYWRARLAGAPEVLAAATDRPRPEELGTDGDRVPIRFDRALHRAVRAAAEELGCTVFMMTHAALSLLLWLRGAGDDVLIGATVAGRLDGALEELVGLFVNTVALRVDLSGDPTVSELVMRARRTDLGALAAQELPFDLVVDALNPRRTMSANPVVQVMLAFQTGRPELPALPGVSAEVELLGLDVAKFDLTFELTELTDPADSGPAGIAGHLEFSTDLYDRSTAIAVVEELGRLLRVLAEEPDRRLSGLGRTAACAPARAADREGR